MQPFLKQVANSLVNKYENDLSELCIVFPNRRSGLFFKKYLGEEIKKTTWAPSIITINDLVNELSDLKTSDHLYLIFELFKTYKKHSPIKENFEEFYYWGEMLLKDFEEIDKYLVDTKQLFTNIKDIKEIDSYFNFLSEEQLSYIKKFWTNFNTKSPSKHQKDFINIWSVLYNIYYEFNTELNNKDLAYEGKQYREVAEKINNGTLDFSNYKKIIFVGFNALNLAEEKIFSHFNNIGLASFYWDYDKYYLENNIQEAGFFLRQNLKNFTQEDENIYSDSLTTQSNKNINFIGTSLEIGQTKLTGQIIDEEINESDYNDTAIILPEEHLLLPILHGLPDNIQGINVTMGYPINITPAFSLIESLINNQKHLQKQKKTSFYYKNVIKILKHQYVSNFDSDNCQLIIDEIEKNNFVNIDDLEFLGKNELLSKIFVKVENTSSLLDYLLDITHTIFQKIKDNEETNSIIEEEFIYHIYITLKRFKEIISEESIELSIDIFIKLLKQILKNVKVPFTGEPLEGMQLMGVLETRSLDFKNVFMLSMNDDVFPKSSSSSSFVPYNLRKGFGLPTYEHNDAMYAYFFYRTLQRAENIYLFYNTEATNNISSEISRFLYQLKLETNYTINEFVLENDLLLKPTKEIEVVKTPDILDKLYRYTSEKDYEKRFFPTAINTYLDCSLKFYFKYICELYESDEVKEEVDPMVFGNILHHSMENIYRNNINRTNRKTVLKEDIKSIKEDIEACIDIAFRKHYGVLIDKPFKYEGNNIIIKNVLEKYIKGIIIKDEEHTPFDIVGLEETEGYNYNLEINSNNKSFKVGVKGLIDRIDKKGNTVRIIDYKTGTNKSTTKSIESLFEKDNKDRNNGIFQVLLYCLLFDKNDKETGQNIVPHLLFVKDIYSKNSDSRISANRKIINDFNEVKEKYIEYFQNTISDLFDINAPFIQTKEDKTCNFCPYINLCHKETS